DPPQFAKHRDIGGEVPQSAERERPVGPVQSRESRDIHAVLAIPPRPRLVVAERDDRDLVTEILKLAGVPLGLDLPATDDRRKAGGDDADTQGCGHRSPDHSARVPHRSDVTCCEVTLTPSMAVAYRGPCFVAAPASVVSSCDR